MHRVIWGTALTIVVVCISGYASPTDIPAGCVFELRRQRLADIDFLHAQLDRARLVDHLDEIDDSTAICASDGQIVFVNHAWRSFARSNYYDGPDFIGQNYLSICNETDGAEMNHGSAVYAGLQGVVDGTVKCFTHLFPCHSPTEFRWFRLSAIPLVSKHLTDGNALVISHTNVTKEVSLVPPETMAGHEARFAHDINSSLNPVLGYLQLANLALSEEPDTTRVVELLDAATAQGDHVVDFLRDVMAQANLFHAGDDAAENIDVADCVRSSMAVHAPSSGPIRARFSSYLDSDIQLKANNTAVRRIADNLITNAVKYNVEGGWLEAAIGLNRSGGIVLTVKDGGTGIEEAALPLIFDAFERGSKNASGIQGEGLGLSSTRYIVESLGGSIGVQSTVGIGSTFTVSFPRWRTQNFQAGHAVQEANNV